MKTISLTELLTPEQIKETEKILDSPGYDFEKTQKLKEYLRQFSTELEAKGVVPDYLAYVLIAKKMRVI